MLYDDLVFLCRTSKISVWCVTPNTEHRNEDAMESDYDPPLVRRRVRRGVS